MDWKAQRASKHLLSEPKVCLFVNWSFRNADYLDILRGIYVGLTLPLFTYIDTMFAADVTWMS